MSCHVKSPTFRYLLDKWFVPLCKANPLVNGDSLYKNPVMRKAFLFHDIIIPWADWLRLVQMAVGCLDSDKATISPMLCYLTYRAEILNFYLRIWNLCIFISWRMMRYQNTQNIETLLNIKTCSDSARIELLHAKLHWTFALKIGFHNQPTLQ